jgi:hypothetical protein
VFTLGVFALLFVALILKNRNGFLFSRSLVSFLHKFQFSNTQCHHQNISIVIHPHIHMDWLLENKIIENIDCSRNFDVANPDNYSEA